MAGEVLLNTKEETTDCAQTRGSVLSYNPLSQGAREPNLLEHCHAEKDFNTFTQATIPTTKKIVRNLL